MFPPRSRDKKLGVLNFPVSREIYVGIPGIVFIFVRVSVVLISIIPTKNAVVLRQIKFFLLIKNYFSKFAKFFKTKCL